MYLLLALRLAFACGSATGHTYGLSPYLPYTHYTLQTDTRDMERVRHAQGYRSGSRQRALGLRPRGALSRRLLQEQLPLLHEVRVRSVAPTAAADARTHQQRLHSDEPWQLCVHEVPVANGEGKAQAHCGRSSCRFPWCVTRVGHWAVARHTLIVPNVHPLGATEIGRARLSESLRHGRWRRRRWRRLRHRPERLDDYGLEGEDSGSECREAREYAAAHRAAAPAPT